jgi:hypothetical protein
MLQLVDGNLSLPARFVRVFSAFYDFGQIPASTSEVIERAFARAAVERAAAGFF